MKNIREKLFIHPVVEPTLLDQCIYLGSNRTWGWDLYIGFTEMKRSSTYLNDLDASGNNPVGVVVCPSTKSEAPYEIVIFNLETFDIDEIGRAGFIIIEKAKDLEILDKTFKHVKQK